MTRDEATALATERVLAVQLAQFRNGTAPVDYVDGAAKAVAWIEEQTRRHADEIKRVALEIMNPAALPYCHCGKPGTSIVDGKAVCDDHAAAAKPAIPEKQQKLLEAQRRVA